LCGAIEDRQRQTECTAVETTSILAADAGASAALALLTILPVFLVAPPCGCTHLDRDPLTPSDGGALAGQRALARTPRLYSDLL
jgi:hypothetical protein